MCADSVTCHAAKMVFGEPLTAMPSYAHSMPKTRGLLTPPPESVTEFFIQRSTSEVPVVACLGVGYVGLHLVKAFAKKYDIVAYDPDVKRLGIVEQELLGEPVLLTSNPADLASATHFLIAVPTSLHHDKTIDTRHLRSAIELVEKYARDNATIVIESSVAVGMTREFLKPLLLSRGFRGGMSPERVDPGRTTPMFEQIPKIISGLDDIAPGSSESIRDLYKAVFENIVTVSQPEVAEMTKLYENCQRMVCLNYANEMADACLSLGIDPYEVSAAAATKPFGYQPYYPGLGVGGHCIPVNPYYLLSNSSFPSLELAAQRMATRPARVGDRIMGKFLRSYQAVGKTVPKILIVGAGFKKGQSVLSNSPGVALMTHLLSNYDTHVEFVDPLVKQEALSFVPKLEDANWNGAFLEESFDIIVVALDQVGLDMGILRQVRGVVIENLTASWRQ